MRSIKILVCLLLVCCLLPTVSFGEEAPQVQELSVTGGVVRFTASAPIAACCFTRIEKEPLADSPDWVDCEGTSFSFFKYDGDYFLWLRDAEGRVGSPYPLTVRSGYHYFIDAEGLSPLQSPAQEVLDVQEANAYIYEQAVEAGLYTREGVLSAGAAVLSYVGERGYTIPYQGKGAYQQEEDWGINPDFGKKLASPVTDANGTYRYAGMQCVGALVWTFKLAGLNLSNEGTGWKIFNIGALAKSNDNKIPYDKAIGGDLVVNGAHVLMIFDRLDKDGDGADDTYLTYEMRSPHLLIMEHSMRSMRYLPFYSMENVYQNQSRYISKARFWPETLRIPEEAFPELLQQAMAQSGQKAALRHLLQGFHLTY